MGSLILEREERISCLVNLELIPFQGCVRFGWYVWWVLTLKSREAEGFFYI